MIRTWTQGSSVAALRNRYFRWLWLGRLASSATFQMSSVAQGWLVYELTGSAFALGWVSAGWSVSTLVLSLYGGVVSDRVDKRTLLLYTRAGMVLNAFVLAVLISMGAVRIWHLAASSLLTGILFAFMMPSQSAIVVELIDRDTLLNANSLNSVGMGLMGIFAAALAGLIIESVGVQGVYYVMGAMYLLALATLTRLPKGQARPSANSVWRDLRLGVRYLTCSPAIRALLALTLVRVLFAMPYRTFMPKYATEVMGMDASGLGLLMAAPGVGSLISSMTVASAGHLSGKGKLLLLAGLGLGLAVIVFAQCPTLVVVLLALGVVGATSNLCMIANQTLLQMNCEEGYIGRIMSMYMMMWGLTPLGTIPAGAIADVVGVPSVLTVQGIITAAAFALTLLFARDVRRLR